MGVARRANRKFRYSRTELGNHYTGVEANNKRVSYNAYLLDVLKIRLRAEFVRLFYRFSYGFKAAALQDLAARYARKSRSRGLRSFRKQLVKKKNDIQWQIRAKAALDKRFFIGKKIVLLHYKNNILKEEFATRRTNRRFLVNLGLDRKALKKTKVFIAKKQKPQRVYCKRTKSVISGVKSVRKKLNYN